LVIQRPTLGRATLDRFYYLKWINAALLRKDQQFAHRRHLRPDHDLIRGFRDLARAAVPNQSPAFAHRLEQWLGLVECLLRPADHEHQRPVLRADLPAAYWGIQRRDMYLRQFRRDLARRLRLDRAVVHEDQPVVYAFGNSIGAKHDLL